MDYYKILNVEKNASLNEIKNSYRILAKKYHPDLNKSEEAEKIFKDIVEAYEILSDEKKRKAYDDSLKKKGEIPKSKNQNKYSNNINVEELMKNFKFFDMGSSKNNLNDGEIGNIKAETNKMFDSFFYSSIKKK